MTLKSLIIRRLIRGCAQLSLNFFKLRAYIRYRRLRRKPPEDRDRRPPELPKLDPPDRRRGFDVDVPLELRKVLEPTPEPVDRLVLVGCFRVVVVRLVVVPAVPVGELWRLVVVVRVVVLPVVEFLDRVIEPVVRNCWVRVARGGSL